MIEEPPFRNRIASVLATLEARERRRRRVVMMAAGVLGTIVVLSVASIAYFSLVGHQNHLLEIQIGSSSYRIISHSGPFTIATPGHRAEIPIAAGNGGYLTEHLRHREVAPRSYLWAPMADTSQIVRLGRTETSCEFLVNGIPFHATEDRLRTAGRSRAGSREWLGRPDRIVVVDVDRLTREAKLP